MKLYVEDSFVFKLADQFFMQAKHGEIGGIKGLSTLEALFVSVPGIGDRLSNMVDSAYVAYTKSRGASCPR